MKITIEFNLPEDQEIYDNFRNAKTMRDALHEFNRHVRTKNPNLLWDEIVPSSLHVGPDFAIYTEGLKKHD